MFNLQATLYQVLASLAVTYAPIYADIKGQVEEAINETKGRLQEDTDGFLAGDISKDFLAERMKDELTIFKTEALAWLVEGKSLAQDAYNNAVAIVQTVIDNVIPPAPAAATK